MINFVKKMNFFHHLTQIGEVFFVGGAVRDRFLNTQSKDIDLIVSKVELDVLISVLKKYGKVDLVGKSFGVIKFKPNNTTLFEKNAIDIALPRKDKKGIGEKHKDIIAIFDKDILIKEDLKRRDATINSMALDSEGSLIDPFDGLSDLKNKILKATNKKTFNDDPLRMLRFISLAARFNCTIEKTSLQLIKKNASKINNVSGERILIELEKIVYKGDSSIGLDLLNKTTLFEHVFNAEFQGETEKFKNVKTLGEFVFLLLQGFPNPEEIFKNRLRDDPKKRKKDQTIHEIKALSLGFEPFAQKDENRMLVFKMNKLSPKALDSKILPLEIQQVIKDLKSSKYPLTIKELAVDGNDLMVLGFKDRQIGEINMLLLNEVYKDNVCNDKVALFSFLKKV